MSSISADSYKKVESTASDLKSKTMDKMNSAEDQFEKYGLEAAKKVESFANSSFDMARDYVETGVKSGVRSSREFVKANPAKGIAIAAAAGLVTGGLIAMLMRKKH